MNIQDRIKETEQKFNEQEKNRQQHLSLAEECLTEMTKLQGEWRILKELGEEPKKAKQVSTIKVNK